MSKKIFYFVDYENVHEAGLAGMNTLPKDSEVHLFYSQNANKLNLDLLRFVKAKLRVHKVKPGKQSLDMQMVSYLGYCIGDEEEDGIYILVSKDTDYANTVLFWREEGFEVRVQPAILEEKNADGMERALRSVKVARRSRRSGKKNTAAQQEADAQAAAPETVKAEEKEDKTPAAAKPQPAEKTAPAEKQSAPQEAAAKKPQPEAAAVTAQPESAASEAQLEAPAKEEKKSTRRGRRGGRGRKSQTENAAAEAAEKTAEAEAPQPAPVQEAPQPEKAEEKAPQPAKPAEKASDEEPKKAPRNTKVPDEPAKVTVTVHDVPMVTHAVPQAKPEKSAAAAKALAVLAESKTDAAVSRKVQSIIQKNEGKKNSRQAIYLEIRKTFGQKMGVDLYNRIKPVLR